MLFECEFIFLCGAFALHVCIILNVLIVCEMKSCVSCVGNICLPGTVCKGVSAVGCRSQGKTSSGVVMFMWIGRLCVCVCVLEGPASAGEHWDTLKQESGTWSSPALSGDWDFQSASSSLAPEGIWKKTS